MLTAHKQAVLYGGEYNYRQGPAFERQLPDFLEEMVVATHEGLLADPSFGAECLIKPVIGDRAYRITFDLAGALITQRVNGEEEDTYRPSSRFEELGGIRDILAQIIENGGLPASASSAEVQINFL